MCNKAQRKGENFMEINYEATSAAVIKCLEQAGCSAATIHEHQLCFDGLRGYLSKSSTPFSVEVALDWLAKRKEDLKDAPYKRYRLSIYRFLRFLECGNIDRAAHCQSNFYAYHDADTSYVKLPSYYKVLLDDFYGKISHEFSKHVTQGYVSGCLDFLLFISEKGCIAPTELTIEYLIEYSIWLREQKRTPDAKKKHISGINNLLTYFYEKGYIPRCYLSVITLDARAEDRTNSLRLPSAHQNNALHPSKKLETIGDEFLSKLDVRCYCKASADRFRYTINDFFKFLEINRIEYSPDAVNFWMAHINHGFARKSRFQVITMFDEYMQTGNISECRKFTWKPLKVELLPDWSRNITKEYLSMRQREGWEHTTIVMGRSSCVRFFSFLDQKGIVCPGDITPALVKEFHNTDPHATPRSRNMYGTGVRKLLEYMAECDLVPANLYLAVSTQYAPCREIVSVLKPEFESALYDYRKNAKSPLELRNAAMIMIGMRMGLRASDIVNMKIDDIDWDKRKLSIIQIKTKKAITLHVPTDVGNSIYKYIKQGRPQSGLLGSGYIFISHSAPFSKLSYVICNKTIDNVLGLYGLELQYGEGFHITRKSFASHMLAARASIDTVADSLGHTTLDTVDSYLAHDEAGMRLCPLSFRIGGME
jgi:site-specific recombinase XerD